MDVTRFENSQEVYVRFERPVLRRRFFVHAVQATPCSNRRGQWFGDDLSWMRFTRLRRVVGWRGGIAHWTTSGQSRLRLWTSSNPFGGEQLRLKSKTFPPL